MKWFLITTTVYANPAQPPQGFASLEILHKSQEECMASGQLFRDTKLADESGGKVLEVLFDCQMLSQMDVKLLAINMM